MTFVSVLKHRWTEVASRILKRDQRTEKRQRMKPIFLIYTIYQSVISHDGMARPQVADGGTASNMEGGCEYIE